MQSKPGFSATRKLKLPSNFIADPGVTTRKNKKNPNKPTGRQFQNTRVPMPKGGTARKPKKMPPPPKSTAPTHGAGVSGRI